MQRPPPPEELLDPDCLKAVFPAPDMEVWLRATFIDEDATLLNEEHAHLRFAKLGVLWCAVPLKRHMNTVVGQAEMPMARGNAWAKARHDQQLEEWFGAVPDFLLTFDATYASTVDDVSFCSLCEHELLHCGQNRDEYGAPKFRLDGTPSFGIKGHDVEEFVGIVERYGARAGAGRTLDFIAATQRAPLVAEVAIQGACGTCGRS